MDFNTKINKNFMIEEFHELLSEIRVKFQAFPLTPFRGIKRFRLVVSPIRED